MTRTALEFIAVAAFLFMLAVVCAGLAGAQQQCRTTCTRLYAGNSTCTTTCDPPPFQPQPQVIVPVMPSPIPAPTYPQSSFPKW